MTSDSEATRQAVERLLILVNGDPTISDSDHPDSHARSVFGRLEAGERRFKKMTDLIQEGFEATREELDMLKTRIEEETFGWHKVTLFIKANWKWLAPAAGFGIYVAFREGWIPI